MASSILTAIGKGYTANTILSYLMRKYPQHEKKIAGALAAGYAGSSILKALDKDKSNDETAYMTDYEKAQHQNDLNKKKARMQAAGAIAGAAALAGGAAYGAFRYATLNKAIQPSAILPPLAGGNAGTPNVPINPRSPNGSTINVPNQQLPNNQRQLTLQQPIQPRAPRSPTSQPSGPVIVPPYEHDPEMNAKLIKNIGEEKRLNEALATGLHLPAISQLLRETLPKGKVLVMDKAPGGFDQVIEDYGQLRRKQVSEEGRIEALKRFNNINKAPLAEQEQQRFNQGYPQQKKPENESITPLQVQENELSKQIQPQQTLAPTQENPVIEKEQDLAQDISKPIVEEIKKQGDKTDRLQGIDVPSILKNIVMTPEGVAEIKYSGPKGLIGEIEGKQKSFSHDKIAKSPEDFEDAVRFIVNSIPEDMKSTAFQTSEYVPLPGGHSIALFKFYDGKKAWYLDLPEDVYDSISMGTYRPKGQGKTSIGEYNPGVVDSRGAGFHTEIKMNPKYSKENKGITWGYAKDSYDMLKQTQSIIHKMSKERRDEEGNLIQPKKRKKST